MAAIHASSGECLPSSSFCARPAQTNFVPVTPYNEGENSAAFYLGGIGALIASGAVLFVGTRSRNSTNALSSFCSHRCGDGSGGGGKSGLAFAFVGLGGSS